ncbi:paraquat-inducible protein A [Roseicyclus sp. F158]|uniref:Paraquat-inducible protein A n=1 Tax=Tropicimonas omnivorans TaxID=3075590 RepID=A0ABU3DF51_9RHOB|nr:paraquat-inducible protein A [Roseicyclus sp. F158]MDT0682330.1 paraquat-inducible protein A [Roseicyclus sp. F158]
MSAPQHTPTAQDAGLIGCTVCAKVWPRGTEFCGRCGEPLRSRDTRSLSRVWAYWIAGWFCYVPANLYPMLRTQMLQSDQASTIVGGAIDLYAHGAAGVALIVLVASVAIPIAKFVAIAYLAISVRRGWQTSGHRRMQLYEFVEFIGRWSMIDVFVVAILSALVQLSVVASIHPGPAALTFALSVVLTMMSARSFDSRMIWDSLEQDSAPEEASPADAPIPEGPSA